jgi:DNA polymerase elongation subunit (family B)
MEQDKLYSYIDVKKEWDNGIKESIFCFYWVKENDKWIKKHDTFINQDYYFYIAPEELEKCQNYNDIIFYPGVYKTINNKECIKISPDTTLNSADFRYFRSRFTTTYESDVPALTRWISKNKPKYSKEVRKIYIDIETIKNETGNYGNIDLADAPVVLITCYDNFENEYTSFMYDKTKLKDEYNKKYKIANTEQDMLIDFINYIKDKQPDYILGWNIESYDIIYILNRLKRFGYDENMISNIDRCYYRKNEEISSHKFSSYYINIGGVGIFDLLSASRRLWLGKYCGYSLKNMSSYYLKETKIDIKDIDKAYKEDFDNLILYNIKDVELCVKLDEKCDIFKSFQAFQDIISTNVESTIIQSNNIIQYLLQKTNIVLMNSHKKHTDKDKTFLGGYVLETKPGIYKNCYKYDFVSMYPSIIVTYNISTDTMLDKKEPGCISLEYMDEKYYFKQGDGIITKVVKELYEERIKQKKAKNKNLTLAYKLLMNSIYGQFTAPYSRIYNYECGQAITLQGRRLLNKLVDDIRKNIDGDVILGDTDSIIFYPHDEKFNPQTIIDLSERYFKEFYEKDGINGNAIIKLEMEKKIDKLIIFGTAEKAIKKKYVEVSEGEVKLVGIDAIKSDTIELAKDMQLDMVNYFIKNEKYSKKELKELLQKVNDKFLDCCNNKDLFKIAIPSKINKEEYVSETFTKKAKNNTKLSVAINELFYVIMATRGPLGFKNISDLDKEEYYIDKNYMWERIKSKADIFFDLLPSEQQTLF